MKPRISKCGDAWFCVNKDSCPPHYVGRGHSPNAAYRSWMDKLLMDVRGEGE